MLTASWGQVWSSEACSSWWRRPPSSCAVYFESMVFIGPSISSFHSSMPMLLLASDQELLRTPWRRVHFPCHVGGSRLLSSRGCLSDQADTLLDKKPAHEVDRCPTVSSRSTCTRAYSSILSQFRLEAPGTEPLFYAEVAVYITARPHSPTQIFQRDEES